MIATKTLLLMVMGHEREMVESCVESWLEVLARVLARVLAESWLGI